MIPAIGDTIGNRYTLIAQYRSHPGLSVWLANDHTLERDCQLSIVSDTTKIDHVVALASFLASSHDSRFTSVYSFSRYNGVVTIMTAPDRGISLRDYLFGQGHEQRHLSTDAIRTIALQVSQAVNSLYAGTDQDGKPLVHQGLSSDTIRLDNGSVTVADTAISPFIVPTADVPYPQYASNTQVRLITQIAKILFEMVTDAPFDGNNREKMSSLLESKKLSTPPEFLAICVRALGLYSDASAGDDGSIQMSHSPYPILTLTELEMLIGEAKLPSALTNEDWQIPANTGTPSISTVPLVKVSMGTVIDIPDSLATADTVHSTHQAPTWNAGDLLFNGTDAIQEVDPASNQFLRSFSDTGEQPAVGADDPSGDFRTDFSTNFSTNDSPENALYAHNPFVGGFEENASGRSAADAAGDDETIVSGSALTASSPRNAASPAASGASGGTGASAQPHSRTPIPQSASNAGTWSDSTGAGDETVVMGDLRPDHHTDTHQDVRSSAASPAIAAGPARTTAQTGSSATGVSRETSASILPLNIPMPARKDAGTNQSRATHAPSTTPASSSGGPAASTGSLSGPVSTGNANPTGSASDAGETTFVIPAANSERLAQERQMQMERERLAEQARNEARAEESAHTQTVNRSRRPHRATQKVREDIQHEGNRVIKRTSIILIVVVALAVILAVAASQLAIPTLRARSQGSTWNIDASSAPIPGGEAEERAQVGEPDSSSGSSSGSSSRTKKPSSSAGSATKQGRKNAAGDKLASPVPSPAKAKTNNTPLRLSTTQFFRSATTSGTAFGIYIRLAQASDVQRVEVTMRTDLQADAQVYANSTPQNPNNGDAVSRGTFQDAGKKTTFTFNKDTQTQDIVIWMPTMRGSCSWSSIQVF